MVLRISDHHRSDTIVICRYIFIIGSCLCHTGLDNTLNSTTQVKYAALNSRKQDALFAVLDGGRSPEAPKLLRPILPAVLTTELREEEQFLSEGGQLQDSLQYLATTFLTAHR